MFEGFHKIGVKMINYIQMFTVFYIYNFFFLKAQSIFWKKKTETYSNMLLSNVNNFITDRLFFWGKWLLTNRFFMDALNFTVLLLNFFFLLISKYILQVLVACTKGREEEKEKQDKLMLHFRNPYRIHPRHEVQLVNKKCFFLCKVFD